MKCKICNSEMFIDKKIGNNFSYVCTNPQCPNYGVAKLDGVTIPTEMKMEDKENKQKSDIVGKTKTSKRKKS